MRAARASAPATTTAESEPPPRAGSVCATALTSGVAGGGDSPALAAPASAAPRGRGNNARLHVMKLSSLANTVGCPKCWWPRSHAPGRLARNFPKQLKFGIFVRNLRPAVENQGFPPRQRTSSGGTRTMFNNNRRTTLTVFILANLALMAGQASAQQAADQAAADQAAQDKVTELQTVQVQGRRAADRQAIEDKRNADNQSDSVRADDVG